MTPKEKAYNLLVSKYAVTLGYPKYDNKVEIPYQDFPVVKNCALIAVDEIINTVNEVSSNEIELDEYYWKEVKQEIEKL